MAWQMVGGVAVAMRIERLDQACQIDLLGIEQGAVHIEQDGVDRLLSPVAIRRCLIGFGHLPQALPAQAVAALHRHWQARRLLGAPAVSRKVAAELRSATGTNEAAGIGGSS